MSDDPGFTAGERDVLLKAARGYSVRYIAYLRGSSPHTVKELLSRARTKLGVQTRAEAIAIARRRWPLS